MVTPAPCVLLCGAGTGGHLYPGVATAQELKRRYPEARVVFAGTGRGHEVEAVVGIGLEHRRIRSVGLKGKSVLAVLRGLLTLPLSAWDGWRVISMLRPRLIIGLGGYSSGAILLMAAARGIPTMVLEQNALPGFTNRTLARVVSAAAVSHESALVHFPRTGVLTGNPVRDTFFAPAPPRPEAAGGKLLVLGGSQGAHAINMAMLAAAPHLAATQPAIAVTHQTGTADFAEVERGYAACGLTARVAPFFSEMAELMRDADVVVGRAGATSLAELTAVGRPAVLVPFPGAADDHQRLNAESLATVGAALVVPQTDLDGARLAEILLGLVHDDERRLAMASASRKLARPRAAASIVDRAEQLLGL